MVHFITASDLHRQPVAGVKPVYKEATKHLSSLVGHECLPEDRPTREAHYREGLEFVNSFCDLGLEPQDVDLFSLYFTALSDSRRFGGDPVMELVQGENPATHSLQATVLKQRVFDAAAAMGPLGKSVSALNQSALHGRQATRLQHAVHSQMAGLAVLMHDMGEVCGEFTTAVQRMNDNKIKEDPGAERTIFTYVLRMALAAQASGDREGFYQRLDVLKKQMQITKNDGSAAGIPKSSEYLSQFLQPPVELSPEQEARFEKLTAIWDMAEGFDHPLHETWRQQGVNVGFVTQLTKSIDHVQGTRHMVRWARKGSIAEIPDYGADRSDIAHINQNRVQGNIRYCEPEAGKMFDQLKPGQNALEAVARQQTTMIYSTISDIMDVSPPLALGYQLDRQKQAVIDPSAPPTEPENPSVAEQKRAQGAMCGLYQRAAQATLSGDFTPSMVDNGKGGTRSQLLGLDGLSASQQEALYASQSRGQGMQVA